MKVVVIGRGTLGSALVGALSGRGVDVAAYGRRDGIDVTTGEGLDDVLRGADVVVDAGNAPVWDDDEVLAFFEAASRNLIAAEKRHGVAHHVVVSIVGADRAAAAGSGYMRGKVAHEQGVRDGGVPFTIARATQFFEFVPTIAESGASGDVVTLTDATIAPAAVDEVARLIADVVEAGPVGGVVEIAGPEAIGIADLARRWFAASGDPRTVVEDHSAGYFGAVIDDDTIVPTPGADVRTSPLTYGEWLKSRS